MTSAEEFWGKARKGSGVKIEPPKRGAAFFTASETPKCGKAFVPLWEALGLAGKATYGADWPSEPFKVRDWPISPVEESARIRANNAALMALPPPPTSIRSLGSIRQAPVADAPPQYDTHVLAYHARRLAQTWQEHTEAEQAAWDSNQADLARIRATYEWLHDRFLDGDIHTATIFAGGGFEPIAAPASDWNISGGAAETRFRTGRYSRTFLHTPPQTFDVFAFVERASLEGQLKLLPHAGDLGLAPVPVLSNFDVSSLSPYLQLAIHLAQVEGISANQHGNKASLEMRIGELRDRFGLDEESLSKSAIPYLGTFIRWPRARKGAGK